jgi:hypothetical protein
MRLAAATFAVALLLGAIGGSASAATTGASASAASAGFFGKHFCDLIGNDTVQDAAIALLNNFAKTRISTESIYTNAVLTSVDLFCQPVMDRAVPAVARFLNMAPKPTQAPTRTDFVTGFGQTTAQTVSDQLGRIGWNRPPQTVLTIANDLCTAIEHGWSTRPALVKWFANARLDSLPALNGLVAFVGTCRPAPTPAQLAYLSSSITSYLTDNTYPRDFTPPVTTLFTPRETTLPDGRIRADLTWSSYDFGGRVIHQDLFVWTNSRWYRLSSASAYLARGQTYQVATRAEDAAGNWSAWVFTPLYAA